MSTVGWDFIFKSAILKQTQSDLSHSWTNLVWRPIYSIKSVPWTKSVGKTIVTELLILLQIKSATWHPMAYLASSHMSNSKCNVRLIQEYKWYWLQFLYSDKLLHRVFLKDILSTYFTILHFWSEKWYSNSDSFKVNVEFCSYITVKKKNSRTLSWIVDMNQLGLIVKCIVKFWKHRVLSKVIKSKWKRWT